jgi:hypothetical protein
VTLDADWEALGKWVFCPKCKLRQYVPESLAYAYDTQPDFERRYYDPQTGRWVNAFPFGP